MKLTKSQLREFIQEVIDELDGEFDDLEDEEVDEATTTGNVQGYMTPRAFSKDGETDDDYIDRLNTSTGYTRVNESKLPVVSVNKKQYDGLESGKSVTVSRLSTGLRHKVDPKMYKKYPKNLKQIEILNPRTKKREVVNVEKVEHEDSGVYLTLVKESINEETRPKNWNKLSKEKEDEQEYKNRWLELKNSDATPNQKIGVGIRKIRRELAEMEKFVNWYSRIRSMNELDKDDYWKRTQRHLKKIKERLIGFAHKIQELDRPIEELSESRIPKPIHDLINNMVNNKIHQKTVTIGDTKKHDRFMKDVKPAVKSKLLRIDHEGNEMKITLGPEAQKMIGETITESDDIAKITHGDDDWYMKRIDGTHVMSANNEKALHNGRGAVYHVRQLNDKPYYDDLRKWLYGKKDIDGKVYKN